MHKLASTPITMGCFELDDYTELDEDFKYEIDKLIEFLEYLRQKYNETKDKRYWKELVRWLPEGWLQTRTVTLNYENLRTICHQRQGHKLTEWAQFADWARELPYSTPFIFDEEK